MNARHELNSASVLGSLLVAGMLGWLAGYKTDMSKKRRERFR